MYKILQSEGVQIHILIYKESEVASKKFLELGTEYTQRVLGSVKNIHVSNTKVWMTLIIQDCSVSSAWLGDWFRFKIQDTMVSS